MPNTVLWFIVGFVILDAIVLLIIVPRILSGAWRSISRDHPHEEPLPDAVHRDFQSFRIGVVNLGGAVHITADEQYLHLEPAGILRMVGATATSIPWEAITIVRRGRRMCTARIAGRQVSGPTWCLELAETDPDA